MYDIKFNRKTFFKKNLNCFVLILSDIMSIKKEEFNEMIFTRINDLIKEYELIKEGEKIVIALSGGKDSVLTLHALKNYHDICGFDFELVAISVDEGIEGYRQHGIDAAVNNAKMLDIPLIQKSFKDEEGFALDDIYSRICIG